jgi:hypothetical protein
VVSPETAGQLAERFRSVWMRPPTSDELNRLIDEHIREEILVREALALSMDSDDAVIRQRLAQKMRFLLESAAGSVVVTDDELRTYFDENAGLYERGGRAAFEQVFLGEAPSEAEVETAAAALRAGTGAELVGRQTLLPATMPMAGARPVDAVFGDGFFARLEELELGAWSGPVVSGYGTHLVRVTGREPGGLPDFAAVRDQVETDWRRQRAADLVEAQYARMAEAYEVERPDGGALAGMVR